MDYKKLFHDEVAFRRETLEARMQDYCILKFKILDIPLTVPYDILLKEKSLRDI